MRKEGHVENLNLLVLMVVVGTRETLERFCDALINLHATGHIPELGH